MINDRQSASVAHIGRRACVARSVSGLVGLPLLTGLTACVTSRSLADWSQADEIRKRVVPPKFPDRVFDIRNYGALTTSQDNTAAISAAISDCHKSGGGRVLVTGGRYLSGPIHLLSNVNLHIDDSSTIAFLTDPKAYLPAVHTRW